MLKIENFITHVDNEDDRPYLKSTLFDVNMRLFECNKAYRRIVQGTCNYLKFCALEEMQGYKKPHGMSGANIAIPFNIIGIVRNRGKRDEYCEVMINPMILDYSKETGLAETNCGSIRLKEAIIISRSLDILVDYYDIDGAHHKRRFSRAQGAFTIQHEVDHNNGVLITDYVEKKS